MIYIVKGHMTFGDTPFEHVENISGDYHVVRGPPDRDDLLRSYPWIEYVEIEETKVR